MDQDICGVIYDDGSPEKIYNTLQPIEHGPNRVTGHWHTIGQGNKDYC